MDCDVDVERALAEFREVAQAPGDPDAFVGWLRETGAIDDAQVTALHAGMGVELTGVTLAADEALAHTLDWRTNIRGVAISELGEPVAEYDGFTRLAAIGEGGMARVHLAKDLDLRRKVALKEMAPGLSNNASLVGRFVDEVQITAQLDHPNIVPVYGLVASKDAPAYSMKLIHGLTLQALIRRAAAAADAGHAAPVEAGPDALLDCFVKVCDAVSFAHDKRVIHRDLKPANVMVGEHGEVYVMDWGIAKVLGCAEERAPSEVELAHEGSAEDRIRTRVGDVMGTASYMAPEQAAGRPDLVDARSDSYALGLILQELVTLQPALDGADWETLVERARTGELRPIEHRVPGRRVPRELGAIIRRATARDHTARYPDAAALGAEVRRHLRNEPVSALPDTPLRRSQRWMSKHREATFALVLGLLLLAVSVFAWSVVRRSALEAEARAREARLGQILTAVGGQSAALDAELMAVEAELEGLVSALSQALSRGEPSDGPWHPVHAFVDPALAPPDLAASKRYRAEVSALWPHFSLPPGLSEAEAEPVVRRIVPLRHRFRRALLATRDDRGRDLIGDRDREREALLHEPTTAAWAYVGLDDGILMEMPGRWFDSAGYDPRVRPWYRFSFGQRGRRWGAPFVEVASYVLALPCTAGLFDASGRPRGVVGMAVSFDHLIERYLRMPGVPSVTHAWLVDELGRIVVQTTDFGRYSDPGNVDIAADHPMPPFAEPELVSAMRQERTGYRRLGGRILVFYPLQAVSWHFVAEATPGSPAEGRPPHPAAP